SYASTFNWTAASLLAKSLGNVEGNTQNRQINGELNFAQLYNKVKLLKTINSPKVVNKNDKNNGPTKNAVLDKKGSGASGKASGTDKGDKGNTDVSGATDVATDKSKDKKTKKEEEKVDKKKDEVLNGNPNAMISNVGGNDKTRRDSLARVKAKEIEKKKKEALALKKKLRGTNPSDGVRVVGRLLMMVKRASFNYNENMGTILPGYMDSTQYLGVNFRNNTNSGLPFAFGYQPDRYWLEGKANDNVLTRDSLFNAPFQQQYAQTFNATVNLEPFKDFKIDLNWNKTFNKAYSELFKDTLGGGSEYAHLNPYETGGFTISYIAIKTMFQKGNSSDKLTRAFSDFENNRKVISSRLGLINPYTGNANAPEDEEYKKGYTRYSQEVLIPAFLSAYTGKNPETFPLMNNETNNIRSNPFKNIFPLPNWRLNYGGLARTKLFKNIFQNFTLNHSYTGTLSMNSFTSALQYRD
ncbi:MAG TPA: cell surface protein SprA, partial [Chitinophagaceae bacterium]|nr:cell surface protein SprA [Chitinophagaceae bacterium]